MRRIPLILAATAAVTWGAVAPVEANAGVIGGSIPLVVDEGHRSFKVPARVLTVAAGVVKFTTLNPKSSRGQHGIGIDGYPYSNVLGAPVKPDRTSSLTVQLEPGKYTIFDSYRKNRKRGFAVRIRVVEAEAWPVPPGIECPVPGFLDLSAPTGFSTLPELRVENVDCKTAEHLGAVAEYRWEKRNFVAAPTLVDGFTCQLELFTPGGHNLDCVKGEQRVHYFSSGAPPR